MRAREIERRKRLNAARQATYRARRKEYEATFGTKDCQCLHCAMDKGLTVNHGSYKIQSELKPGEVNRIVMIGDRDYRKAQRMA